MQITRKQEEYDALVPNRSLMEYQGEESQKVFQGLPRLTPCQAEFKAASEALAHKSECLRHLHEAADQKQTPCPEEVP
jgi:hypothetical protein